MNNSEKNIKDYKIGMMKSLQEWKNFYEEKGIEVSLYNTDDIDTAIGLHLNVGKNDVRVLFIGNLQDKSYAVRKMLLENVLDEMYLSRNYPWVINSHNVISIIVRCKEEGCKMFNSPPLLWNTDGHTIAHINDECNFFNGTEPDIKPIYVSSEIILMGRTAIENLHDFAISDVHSNLNISDLALDAFMESWSLREFLEEHGPKMQLGGWALNNSALGEHYSVVRFGDIGKNWVYAYVSLRIREVSVEKLQQMHKYLRIGMVKPNHYVLYDNNPKERWTDINIEY